MLLEKSIYEADIDEIEVKKKRFKPCASFKGWMKTIMANFSKNLKKEFLKEGTSI